MILVLNKLQIDKLVTTLSIELTRAKMNNNKPSKALSSLTQYVFREIEDSGALTAVDKKKLKLRLINNNYNPKNYKNDKRRN